MSELLGLTHEQQQAAVERIQQLQAEQGLTMAEAMRIVIAELKSQHSDKQ